MNEAGEGGGDGQPDGPDEFAGEEPGAERYRARVGDGDEPRAESDEGTRTGSPGNGLSERRLDRSREPAVGPDGSNGDPLEELQQHLTTGEIQALAFKNHSGPLPAPEDLIEYERAVPGLANRIVSMAEREQRTKHKALMIPLRAEASAFVMSTFAVSFMPWALFLIAAVLLWHGEQVAALISGAAGTIASGPQIIAATRRNWGRDASRGKSTESPT